MTFEKILSELKAGKKVIRKGWVVLSYMSHLYQEKTMITVQ